MKRAKVSFPIGYNVTMTITRYVGTGTVLVHESNSYTEDIICKYTCSVGDLPEEAQLFLNMCGLGCSKQRPRKGKKRGALNGR